MSPLLNKKAQGNAPRALVASENLPNSTSLRSILLRDFRDWNRLVVASVSGLSELGHTFGNNLLHRLACRLQVVARIELLGSLRENFADRARDRQALVGVDVDLAHAISNSELNLFDRSSPRRLQADTILVDDVLQILRHAR